MKAFYARIKNEPLRDGLPEIATKDSDLYIVLGKTYKEEELEIYDAVPEWLMYPPHLELLMEQKLSNEETNN